MKAALYIGLGGFLGAIARHGLAQNVHLAGWATNDDVRADSARRYSKGQPLNHIGLVVDDLDAAERVVLAAGLESFSHDDYEPGRRFYFFDWDGIEFEIVSYDEAAR